MPTLIAGVVAVVVIYTLLQMFRAANPGRACARRQDRWRRRGAGGGGLHRACGANWRWRSRSASSAPVCSAGRRSGRAGFSNIGGMFGGGTQRSSRPDLEGALAVSRHDARSRQRRAVGPDRGRAACRDARSTSSTCRSSVGDDPRASTPRASRYLKAILTAGFPPGVRTRRATRQGGSAARRRAAK